MDNWFVLFVRNGSEPYVVDRLKQYLDSTAYTPFILTKTYPHISGGHTNKITKPFFPGGYVFLSSARAADEVIADVMPVVAMVSSAYGLLHYGDNKRDIAMHPRERDAIQQLLNFDFHADGSYGFFEGDAIRVSHGPLIGLESRIKKINRRKKTATVELDFVGARREIVLMLDVLEKQ